MRKQYGSASGLVGSFSKKDPKVGIVDDNCDGFDIDICPDLLLAAIGAAAAGAFAILFTAITMAGRRKKRSIDEANNRPDIDTLQLATDMYWIGTSQSFF